MLQIEAGTYLDQRKIWRARTYQAYDRIDPVPREEWRKLKTGEKYPLDLVAEDLIDHCALTLASKDNVTAMVVLLRNVEGEESERVEYLSKLIQQTEEEEEEEKGEDSQEDGGLVPVETVSTEEGALNFPQDL